MSDVISSGSSTSSYSYEASPIMKIFSTLAAILIAIVLIVVIAQPSQQQGLTYLYFAVIAAIGTYLWLRVLRRRLVLSPDGFEYRGVFTELRGGNADLKGYRIHRSRYGRSFEFFLIVPERRSFTTPDYRNRPGFSEWLNKLTDLDVADRAAFEKDLLDNSAFGLDPIRRKAAIAFQRKALMVVTAGGVAAAAWLFLYPKPLEAAIIACVVFCLGSILIAALSGGRYAVMSDIRNPKLKLTYACLAPAAALGFAAFQDKSWLDKMAAAPVALGCAAVLVLIIILIDGRSRMQPLIVVAACLAAGCWGATLDYDRLADTTQAVSYMTPIVSKRTWHGSRNGTHYELEVASWGGAGMPTEFDTNAAYYDSAEKGQSLCVNLHKGALGYRWVDYGSCPDKVVPRL